MVTQREMLQRNVDWRGDDVALKVVDTGEAITYNEFNERMNQFANALRDRGIRSGDRVAMVLRNTLEFPVTLFACYKLGAVPVPLNYMLARDNFTYIVDDIDPAAVVFDAEFSETVEGALEAAIRPVECIGVGTKPTKGATFEGLMETGSPEEPPVIPADPGRISYILYTSGTTGKPKGVTITQRTANYRIQEGFATTNVSPSTVSLQLSPWFHAGGLGTTLHPTLCGGGTMLVTTDWEPERVAEYVEAYGVTFMVCIPTVAQRIAELDDIEEYDLSSLEFLLCQGSPLSEDLANDIIDNITPNLYNGYGTTETLYDVQLRPNDLPEQCGAAGSPGPAKQIRVVEHYPGEMADPDEVVETGEEGEIISKGEAIMDYYFGNQEATTDAKKEGWFYTSDLGYIDEDGYLTITGRADDMILSGGELVSPIEVEETLEKHDGVETAVAVGVPDEEWGSRVKAFVKGEATPEELERFCKDHQALADYKRPRKYETIEIVERTATGKKQRYKYRPDS
jgi:acyl-CoA synthetase (AMP-forming)/AMP-acid ligase II